MTMTIDAHRQRRIITIDDNPEIHKDFRTVLLPADSPRDLADMETALFGDTTSPAIPGTPYELDHAYQGREGFDMVFQAVSAGRPYALAFVDMRMPPGWDGVETIRRIWQADPDVQIVICTAYSDYDLDDLRKQFRRTDSLLILKKPFDAAEVEQLASALTEKWTLARQAALKMEELERLVQARTTELAEANKRLREEIVRRTRTEEELRRLSLIDGLTGIPNRRLFDEMLDIQWGRALDTGSLSQLVMIDLDYFKAFNDHYGHLAGDDCLRRVAGVLNASVRRRKDLLARYGGEEFGFILPDTDAAGAALVARRLRECVEQAAIPHEYSAAAPVVTVSVGCATCAPEIGLSTESLIRRADQALYRAKQAGRNRVVADAASEWSSAAAPQ